MEVRLARKMGFCRGVEHAIEMAEEALRRHSGTKGVGGAESPTGASEVSSLGEIIHNPQVVQHLAEAGLKVIHSPQEARGVVLIRSHGEPPEVLQQLRRSDVEVLDATCVLVKRAQKVVAELAREGYRVVVVGQASHPEVRAICGYAPEVICVDSPADLDRLPLGGKLGIICQTTHSVEFFGEMVGRIVGRGYSEIKVINTVCGEVRARQEAAVELSRQVEVMFVLGGRQSANTRELARLCRQHGVVTYHLEGWQDFRGEMVAGRRVAGVTAGASTPKRVVEDFVEHLRAFQPEVQGEG